ncbi:uncharacterized protein BDR25DRAFT_353021 [Lindgomyces ingoldianus]|uniref:Uncharacterized protein n=1 Tax=Lindgomyces ingoldianus TaxID=673940 RepID=A0ACB6R096_9PLEO|nr:uncharacterized protein BDR25DRAFT_353021 [Lindgomyces ingoldianus]KAF2472698.1 hypothetical protein BDR25DRAFT_353021 [Lindgomyces ingoldianus]
MSRSLSRADRTVVPIRGMIQGETLEARNPCDRGEPGVLITSNWLEGLDYLWPHERYRAKLRCANAKVGNHAHSANFLWQMNGHIRGRVVWGDFCDHVNLARRECLGVGRRIRTQEYKSHDSNTARSQRRKNLNAEDEEVTGEQDSHNEVEILPSSIPKNVSGSNFLHLVPCGEAKANSKFTRGLSRLSKHGRRKKKPPRVPIRTSSRRTIWNEVYVEEAIPSSVMASMTVFTVQILERDTADSYRRPKRSPKRPMRRYAHAWHCGSQKCAFCENFRKLTRVYVYPIQTKFESGPISALAMPKNDVMTAVALRTLVEGPVRSLSQTYKVTTKNQLAGKYSFGNSSDWAIWASGRPGLNLFYCQRLLFGWLGRYAKKNAQAHSLQFTTICISLFDFVPSFRNPNAARGGLGSATSTKTGEGDIKNGRKHKVVRTASDPIPVLNSHSLYSIKYLARSNQAREAFELSPTIKMPWTTGESTTWWLMKFTISSEGPPQEGLVASVIFGSLGALLEQWNERFLVSASTLPWPLLFLSPHVRAELDTSTPIQPKGANNQPTVDICRHLGLTFIRTFLVVLLVHIAFGPVVLPAPLHKPNEGFFDFSELKHRAHSLCNRGSIKIGLSGDRYLKQKQITNPELGAVLETAWPQRMAFVSRSSKMEKHIASSISGGGSKYYPIYSRLHLTIICKLMRTPWHQSEFLRLKCDLITRREVYFAMKVGSLRIRPEGHNANSHEVDVPLVFSDTTVFGRPTLPTANLLLMTILAQVNPFLVFLQGISAMKMLCKCCSQIFRGPCPHEERDHHYSVRELEQAAFEKCHICRVLWKGISNKAPHKVKANPTEATGHRHVPSKPYSKHRMRHKVLYTNQISELSFVVDRNGVLNGVQGFLFCLQTTSDGHNLLGKSRSALPQTWDESMDVATEWLSACQRDYKNYRTHLFRELYPETSSLHHLFIPKEGTTGDKPGITAGHCWGSSKPLTLTSNSLAALQAGVEIAMLPQIDSLCIFQDSKDDWAEQAPQMSHIYRNGGLITGDTLHCTVAYQNVTPPAVLHNLAGLGQGLLTDQSEDTEAAQLPTVMEECVV